MLDLFFDQREGGEEGFAGAVVDAGALDEGETQVGKALEGHLDEVLAVHPETFVEVEAGAAPVDVFQFEEFDDLLDGEDFAVVLRRPSEETKVIAHRLGRVALRDVILHTGALVALAHLGTIGIEDERDVGEPRRLDSEGFVELDVLRCVGQMVFAADDIGDLHFDIVDHIDEVENPRPVRAAHGHVGVSPGIREIENDGAADFVMDGDAFARGAETQRAGILVNHALVLKNFQVAFVNRSAFALVIGSVIAALLRALVPVESEPAQTVINPAHGLVVVALAIGVLDAQDKRSSGMAGVQPVE